MVVQQFIGFALFNELIYNDIKNAIQKQNINYLNAILKANPQRLIIHQVKFKNQLNDIVKGIEDAAPKYMIFLINIFELIGVEFPADLKAQCISYLWKNLNALSKVGFKKIVFLFEMQTINERWGECLKYPNLINAIIDSLPEKLHELFPKLIKGEKWNLANRLIKKDTSIYEKYETHVIKLFNHVILNQKEVSALKILISPKLLHKLEEIRNRKKEELLNFFIKVSDNVDQNIIYEKLNKLSCVINLFNQREIIDIVSHILRLNIQSRNENRWINTLFFIIEDSGYSIVFDEFLEKLKELDYQQAIRDFFIHYPYKIASKSIEWILSVKFFALDILKLNNDFLERQNNVELFKKCLDADLEPSRVIRLFFNKFPNSRKSYNEILKHFIEKVNFTNPNNYQFSHSLLSILLGGLYLGDFPIEFTSELVEVKLKQFYQYEESYTYFPYYAPNLWKNFKNFDPEFKRMLVSNFLNNHYDALFFFAIHAPEDFKNYLVDFLKIPDEKIRNQKSYFDVLITFLNRSVDSTNFHDQIYEKCKNFSDIYQKARLLFLLGKKYQALTIITFLIKSTKNYITRISYYFDYFALFIEQNIVELDKKDFLELSQDLENFINETQKILLDSNIKIDLLVKKIYLQGRINQILALLEKNENRIRFLEKSNGFFKESKNIPNLRKRIRKAFEEYIRFNHIVIERNTAVINFEEFEYIKKTSILNKIRLIPPLFTREEKLKHKLAILKKKCFEEYRIVYEWDKNKLPTEKYPPIELSDNVEKFNIEILVLDLISNPDSKLYYHNPLKTKRGGPFDIKSSENEFKVNFNFQIHDITPYLDRENNYTLCIQNLNQSDDLILYFPVISNTTRISSTSKLKGIIPNEILTGLKVIQRRHNILRKEDEDNLNDLFADLMDQSLKHINLHAVRESRSGVSETGLRQGEVDIYFIDNDNNLISVLEALKSSNNLVKHFKKIFGYDTIGHPVNFLVTYCFKENLEDFWQKYQLKINNLKGKYQPEKTWTYPDNLNIGNEMRVGITHHSRSEKFTEIYHIVAKIEKTK